MNKNHLLFVIVLLLCGMADTLAQQSALTPPLTVIDWDAQKKKAIGLHANGEYDEAARLLKDFPVDDTAYAMANFYHSSACLIGQRYREGIDVAQRGLMVKDNPYRQFLLDFIGASFYELEQYDSSRISYSAAAKEFPLYYRNHLGIALAAYQQKDYQVAVEKFQYTVKLNPFNELSHYFLGLICMENNYIVPAMLSFQMYLLLDESGDRAMAALTAYEKLAKGGWMVEKDSMYWTMPAGSNDFAELEKLIRSKVALSDKYKAKVDIGYAAVVKQMQLTYEQLKYVKADTGFWMQYYVPFVAEVWSKGYYEGVAYHAFSCLKSDPDVVKAVKKNNAAVSKMIPFASTYWVEKRQDFWKELGLSATDPWFNDKGALKSFGTFDEKINKPVGYWKYLRNNGFPDHEGLFDQKGLEQGVWKYYDESGRKIAERSTKDGKLNDTTRTFHENGAPEEINVFSDSRLNGTTVAYYSTGACAGKVTFVQDVRDGPFEYYYETGGLKVKGQYKKGVQDGLTEEFHPNGLKKDVYTVVNGKTTGENNTWYDNGTLQSSGFFTDGKQSGKWTYYYRNGMKEREGEIVNGSYHGNWKYYNDKGVLTRTFNAVNGLLEGEDIYYSPEGRLWAKYINAKGKTNSYQYFDETGKVITEVKRDGKKLRMQSFHPNGMKWKEGEWIDGIEEGAWKEYNQMGVLVRDETYVGGKLNGEQRYYYNTGEQKSVFNYVDGLRQGLAKEYYYNGKVSKQVMFKDDQLNGYYYEYRIDGQPEEITYYINGKPNGTMTQYDCKGRKRRSFLYALDDLKMITAFDTLGKVISVAEIPTGNGTVKVRGMGTKNPVLSDYKYKYGHLDGEILDYHSEGLLYRSTVYKHGTRNGWRKIYDFEGKMKESSYYLNGDRDSLYTSWMFGEKVSEQWYKDGELHGLTTWYHQNGKVETTGSYESGERNGFFHYYAPDGQLRFRLNYRDGIILSYSYLGPDSTFVPEVLLKNGTGTVKAFFRNGKPSADFSFKNGFYDGAYTLYFTDGKKAYQTSYKNTLNQGPTVEYYSDGKPMSEENYVDDELNGQAVYYYPGGQRRMTADMMMGKYHGWVVLYDPAGKVKKKYFCYNDDIIE